MLFTPARPVPEKFSVAISLAGEQRDFVRAIAEALENELGRGTVFFDEWFESHLAGADADLNLQEIYGSKCELAVFCLSKAYSDKPWTQMEYRAIRARYMRATDSMDRREKLSVLPVRVGDGDVDGILYNTIAPDIRSRSPDQCAQLILERLFMILPDLRMASRTVPAPPAWPDTPPTLAWPMADHTAAREAFTALLSSRARWRFLPIRGASETGKSHISRQMLANALAIPEIACGRFDFKGTTDMDAEVKAFVAELGVPVPPPDGSLHGRLGHVNTAWQSDLAVAYSKQGDVFREQGNLAEALAAFEHYLSVIRLAEQDPSNTAWQRELAVAHGKVGSIHLDQGKLSSARSAFEKSLEISHRLAMLDPDNTLWQSDLATSYSRMGRILAAQNKPAEALTAFLEDLEISRRLTEQDSSNVDWKRTLAVTCLFVARMYDKAGRLKDALPLYEEAVRIYSDLVEKFPGFAAWPENLKAAERELIGCQWRV